MRAAPVIFLLLPALAGAAGFWPEGLKNIPLGETELSFGGELRLRCEYQNEYSDRGYSPGQDDRLLLERVMLEGELRHEKARLFVQLRDAHAFFTRLRADDFPGKNPFDDHLDIRQLYLHLAPSSDVSLKVGRQQISYGDQRLFGPGQWGNTGRYVWDAAVLKLKRPGFLCDVWLGRFVITRPQLWPDRPADGPTALVIYNQIKNLPLRWDIFYTLKYDGRGSTKGESGAGNLASHSLGTQLEGRAPEPLVYGVTAVVQLGRQGRDELAAYGANLKLGAEFKNLWNLSLVGQMTWGSGDADPNDGRRGTFDGVFGGADLNFYGQMNLFFWANLHDYELDVSFSPFGSLRVDAMYHYFMLDSPRDAWYTRSLKEFRRDPEGLSGRELGHELDLRAVWKAGGGFELWAGYGHFFPGAFVRATGAATSADWFMLQGVYGF